MPPLHSTPVGAVLPGAGSARGPHRCSAGVIFSPSLPCSHIAHRGTGTVHSRPTQDIRARAWLITIRSRVFRPLLGPTHCVTMYLGLAPVCSSPSFSASSRLPPAAPLKNSISSRRPHRPSLSSPSPARRLLQTPGPSLVPPRRFRRRASLRDRGAQPP